MKALSADPIALATVYPAADKTGSRAFRALEKNKKPLAAELLLFLHHAVKHLPLLPSNLLSRKGDKAIDDFIAKSIKSDGDFLEAYSPDRNLQAFELALKERASGAVSEVHAFEPNYEGSPIIWLADVASSNAPTSHRHPSAKGNHRFEANAGHHLAPAMLSSGQNVFEKLGSGFTLLALGAHPESVNAFRVAANAMNLPLTIVEDSFEGEVKRYQAHFVLIRPDHFVAWTSLDAQLAPHLPKQLLNLARGALEN
jgi:hypothetical protein